MTNISKPNVNLLPNIFRTDTNKNFINATIDQLTQPNTPVKLFGYIGERGGIYNISDQYLSSTTAIRQNYQLVPGTVIRNHTFQPQKAITFDDLLNQLEFYGVNVSNQNKLFEQDFYCWAPPVDYDKLVNYTNYYWVSDGPTLITITEVVDVNAEILGKANVTIGNVKFTNGLKIKFTNDATIPISYQNNPYIVEGVGQNIRLVPFLELVTPETYNQTNTGEYDSNPYDTTAYDVNLNKSTTLDYITVNKGSKDRNAWSRNNRWFHKNVLEYSAEYNNLTFDALNYDKAKRPIIEFESDIKLWDHGTDAKEPIDLINFDETDVFSSIVGQSSGVVKIDDVYLIDGMRVIFAGDTDEQFVKNKTLVVEVNETEPEDQGPFIGTVLLDLADGGYQKITTAGSVDVGVDPTSWASSGKIRAMVVEIELIDGSHIIDLYQPPLPAEQINYNLPFGFSFPTTPGTYTYQLLSDDSGATVTLTEKTDKIYTLNLIPATDFEPTEVDHMLVKYGAEYGKTVFTYTGSTWRTSRQQKTNVQQAPLFDLFDNDAISLNDQIKYAGSSFTGNKLFGYAQGTGSDDLVLGFPIKYQTYNGIGDIVFENYIQTESYSYLFDQLTTTIDSSICFFKQDQLYKNDYVEAIEKSKQFLIYSALVTQDGGYILTIPSEKYTESELKTFYLFKNNKLLTENVDYSLTGNQIFFNQELLKDDYIEIKLWNPSAESNLNSYITRFETPINALADSTNEQFISLTLGQFRQQVASAVQNVDITGNYPGESNLRDFYVKDLSNLLFRNTAGLTLPNFLLTDEYANIINSIRYAKTEYTKFKQKFLHIATQIEFTKNIQSMFNRVMYTLIANKDNTFPFTFSNMFAFGDADATNTYTILDPNYKEFSLTNNYEQNTASKQTFLVFLTTGSNTTLLIRNYDYHLMNNNVVRVIKTLNQNDQVVIKEYYNTDGTYCPPTPTKLGLWPAFKPEMYVDDTLINTTTVIQGHDGSITPAFGDFRDSLLLELETRIYNAITVTYNSELFDYGLIVPGRYRENYFSQQEFNNIISKEFLNWSSRNSVKYNKNNYDYNIPFTWNFSDTTDTETGEQLPGFWRTIYRYYYDTDRPHTHPWEMLGLSERPDWWINEYGDAPYTSDNLVLWQDLAAGYVRAGDQAGTILTNRVRDGLMNRIPVDHQGVLLPPNEVGISNLTLNYDVTKSWAISDIGPVQSAWMRSSEYPYAMQIAAILCKPSMYSYKMFDCDLLIKNIAGQWVNKHTLLPVTVKDLKIQGIEQDNTVYRGSGYQHFLSDWFRQQNYNRETYFYNKTKYLTSNLLYKLAGYSDNSKVQFYLEKNTPGSSSSNTQIPSENIIFLNNSSTPVSTIDYSGMVIERTENGYSITGYDYVNGYFNILPVIKNQNAATVKLGQISEAYTEYLREKSWQPPQIFRYNNKFYRVIKPFSGDIDPNSVLELDELPSKGGITVVQYKNHELTPVQISYGTEFSTEQDVYDFINGYHAYLSSIGIIFDNTIPGTNYEASYLNSAKEFLFWTLQKWVPGSVIKLSPGAYKLRIKTAQSFAQDSSKLTSSFYIVDQDGLAVKETDIAINRFEDITEIVINTNSTALYGIKLAMVDYEHIVIFDNNTLFNDLIYDPINGYKQKRIKVSGYKSGGWDGSFGGSGFIVDTGLVDDWEQYKDYRYGDSIQHLNKYYFANKNHVGTELFNFDNWDLMVNEPKSRIYSNLDTKVTDLEKAYDMISVLGNEDIRTSAAHQMGYNEKNYLDPLIPEELSQIKFYQGFIKQKGTKNSLDAFKRADLTGSTGEINIYEEWAIRVGEYGSVDNTQNIKIVLREDDFKNNPQIITFKQDAESTSPNNTIFLKPSDNRIIEKPKNFTGDIWKKLEPGIHQDSDLLTSGHVRLNEIDYTLININDIENTNVNYTDLVSGVTIFCAFDYTNSWNVYRLGQTDATVLSLNIQLGTSRVEIEFDTAHGIVTDEWFLIKNSFNSYLNGWHKAYAVDKPTCLVFDVETEFNNSPPVTELKLLKLESLKFATVEDLLSFQPIDRWNDDEYAWVVDNGNGTWATYVRNSPYDNITKILANNQTTGSKFGNSVVSTDDDYFLIVAGNEVANIFKRDTYNPTLGTTTDLKIFNTLAISVPATITSNNFGGVMAIGGESNMTLIADPLADYSLGNLGEGRVYTLARDISNAWGQDMILSSPTPTVNGNFGSSLSISKSGTHTSNTIIVGDNTNNYTLSGVNSINVTKASDVKVYLNSTLLSESVEYSFNRTINLTIALGLTDYITLDTTTPYVISGTGANNYTISADVFADTVLTDVTKLKITRNGSTVPMTYGVDYTIDDVVISLIGGPITTTDFLEIITDPVYAYIGESGTNSLYVYISRTIVNIWQQIQTITDAGSSAGDKYGSSNAISDNGNKLVIGASFRSSNTGTVYLYEKTGLSKYSMSYSLVDSINGENINDFYGNALEISPDGNSIFVAAYRASPNQNGKVYIVDFNTQTLIQTLTVPETVLGAQFGYSLSLNPAGTKLVIGSVQSGNRNVVPFDNFETKFDNNGTIISDFEDQSGKAWIYNKYTNYFYFEQSLSDFKVKYLDQFSKSLHYSNHAVYIGAPNDDTYGNDAGLVYEFDNQTNSSSWEVVHAETSRVKVQFEDKKFIYNSVTGDITDYIDSFDPAKGKILGIAEDELFYKTSYDPAFYDIGTTAGVRVDSTRSWGDENVGRLWWDLSSIRYLNYEQGDLNFRKTYWGQLFPGCTIDIYEWVKSSLLPSEWLSISLTPTGVTQNVTGMPKHPNDSVFCVRTEYNSVDTNNVTTFYYYWVKNTLTVPNDTVTSINDINQKSYVRQLSAAEVAGIITDPNSAGYQYLSYLDSDTIACYNINQTLMSDEKVLSIQFDNKSIDNPIHTEWLLFKSDSEDKILDQRFDKKLVDSLVGQDTYGNIIPDPLLKENIKYGTLTIPRQSFFKDRREAMKILIDRTNAILQTRQIVYERDLTPLYAKEAIPSDSSGVYDTIVDTYEDLTYLDVPAGTKILVVMDSTSMNKWAIYQYSGTRYDKVRIQSYNVPISGIWEIVDWYQTGYDENTIITNIVDDAEVLKPEYNQNTVITNQVDIEADLLRSTFQDGAIIKVNNVNGIWRLYYNDNGTLIKVGEQNATIRFTDKIYDNKYYGFDVANYDANAYDDEPTLEIRYVVECIKNNILISDLSSFWNDILIALLRYIHSEQGYVDWLFKTSFIDIDQNIRTLTENINYIKDNSNGFLDFITELKPYHTKIREHNVIYNRLENNGNYVTDFDLPPYFDTEQQKYVIPNYTNDLLLLDGDVWIYNFPYAFYASGYRYYVDTVEIFNGGSGYTSAAVYIKPNDEEVTQKLYNATGSSGATIALSNTTGIYPGMYVYSQAPFLDQSNITVIEVASDTAVVISTEIPNLINNQTLQFSFVRNAVVTATINGTSISNINIIDNGSGYTLTPEVLIYGDGVDARALVRLENNQVRTIKTNIRFDRVNSTNDIQQHTINYTVSSSNDGINNYYNISGIVQNNPTLILERGNNYVFNNNASGDSLVISRGQNHFNIDQYNYEITGNYPCAFGQTFTFSPTAETPDVLYYASYADPVPNTNKKFGIILIVDPMLTRSRFMGNGSERTYYLPLVKTFNSTGYVNINGELVESSLYTVIPANVPVLSESISLTQNSFTLIVSNSSKLRIGQSIVGNSIRSGVYITNINGTTITMNKPITDTTTSIITVYGSDRVLFNSPPVLGDIIDIFSDDSSTYNNDYHAADRILAYYKPTESQLPKEYAKLMKGAEYGETVVRGPNFTPALSEDDIDENLKGPAYVSYWGLDPSDIVSDGSKFIDTTNSYAPEENIPAQIFDTLDLKVYTEYDPSTALGVRIFKNMANRYSYTRIGQTVTLAQALLSTDTEIYLSDTSILADPNPVLAIPGVIFVNGERIEYYEIDRIDNKLTKFRRGCQGTGVLDEHDLGSIVYDGSIAQKLPDIDVNTNIWVPGTSIISATTEMSIFLRANPSDLPV